jgi:pimeloyl-ACP methyl ester carboxylesterase
VRREINGIVAGGLTDEPTVVVGHSLGSVVAYDLLRNSRGAQVPLLMTIGSPLGIRAVRNPFRPIRSPAPVAAWTNAFDPRDVVALAPLDRENFDVAPPIRNIGDIRNQTENRHGIIGYLDKAAVAGPILRALG